jgi:hypothetical protein
VNNTVMLLLVGGLVVAVVLVLLMNRKKGGTVSPDPIAEAEVFMAYGRKKEAKAALERHLESNPGDPKAIELLLKCQ